MVNEVNIILDIYGDIINKIEHIKSSRLRLENIKNNIKSLNNNYFETKCNDVIFYQYLQLFDDVNILENLEILKKSFEEKLCTICDHEWVNDLIDIDPDRSKEICYCLKCEITKK